MSREKTHLYESLVSFGAPLLGFQPRQHLPLEKLLPRLLAVASDDATMIRTLPLVIARHKASINWDELEEEARSADRSAAIGMLIELTADLQGDGELRRQASRFERRQGEPVHWFPPRGPYGARLAMSRTPGVARKWGYLMNMPEETFRAVLEKHGA